MANTGFLPRTSLWGVIELSFQSDSYYANPLQECKLSARFISPDGREHTADGFWDGGREWRVRFMPGEEGTWSYTTQCSDESNASLNGNSGEFEVVNTPGGTMFSEHGAVGCSKNMRHFEHADGTPFFWLGDTAWNGPLLASDSDWDHYLSVRKSQGFDVVQWVATQWRSAPNGDADGRLAYSGYERIMVNPQFFQRLDTRVRATNEAGLLNAVVMLWAHPGRAHPEMNPGHALPEDQAVLLGRYMVARWGAYHVAWVLAGDGDYSGELASRWHRIGNGVFGDSPHAPVAMHFRGKQLPIDDFNNQVWLDVLAYQSGHYDDDQSLKWIFDGPATNRWQSEPVKILLNSEPPYEDHMAPSGKRFDAHAVRRAIYWSLLNAPTPGVTYGGHGIWAWDNGVDPAADHLHAGVPLKWTDALRLEAGSQVQHARNLLESLPWTELVPNPDLIANQPDDPDRHIAAAQVTDGSLVVAYTPINQRIELAIGASSAEWVNPRTGIRSNAVANQGGGSLSCSPPGEGDWVLVVKRLE